MEKPFCTLPYCERFLFLTIDYIKGSVKALITLIETLAEMYIKCTLFLLPQASHIFKYSATNYIHRFAAGRPVTSGFAKSDLDWGICQVYRKPIATTIRWWTLTPDIIILTLDIELYGLSIKSRNFALLNTFAEWTFDDYFWKLSIEATRPQWSWNPRS